MMLRRFPAPTCAPDMKYESSNHHEQSSLAVRRSLCYNTPRGGRDGAERGHPGRGGLRRAERRMEHAAERVGRHVLPVLGVAAGVVAPLWQWPSLPLDLAAWRTPGGGRASDGAP